ncbi:MAG: hypothetical protein ACPG9K_07720 [Poseidonibacter sp.]
MKTKLKLAGVMLGAALTTTAAFAGSGGSCGAGKCGGETKKMEKKGSCGAGKCGGDTKKKDMKKGSCGAGKCGGDTKKDMKKKATGACGAGKCG